MKKGAKLGGKGNISVTNHATSLSESQGAEINNYELKCTGQTSSGLVICCEQRYRLNQRQRPSSGFIQLV
jgi:hypothetical protein